jgi:hypothetical protein
MRYVLTSSGQIIRRLVRCVELGYVHYVTGWIPEGKDPKRTDEKLIRQYGIARSKMALLRQFKAGKAKLRLYRFGRFFVLLATDGDHPFFHEEWVNDIRVTPLRYNGFAIRWDGGKVRVRWSDKVYRKLRGGFVKAALKDEAKLDARLEALRHPIYPDIVRQKEAIIKAVKRRRKVAGKPRLRT